MNNASTTPAQVLVLETQAKASLPIIESMAKRGRYVIAAAPVRACAGKWSRHVAERLLSPDATKEPDAYVEWLLRFLDQRNIDMLMPVGDVATDLCARHRESIGKLTRVALADYDSFRTARNKMMTISAARAAGIPIPRTVFPSENDAWRDEVVFPALIKPAVAAGARGITPVACVEDVEKALPSLQATFGDCFIQEFVEGVQQKADAVIGPEGQLLTCVVYDKLRYYPPEAGSSVLNETVHRPDIVESVNKILSHLGWYGFCDFDFITDRKDGVGKLIEINPRFPESYRATVVAGIDMTEMVWQLAHGKQPAPQLDYEVGRQLRFFPGDLMWMLTATRRRDHLRSWFRFFGTNLDYQVCSVADPGAICGYVAENLLLLLDAEQRMKRFRLASALRKE